MVEMRQRVRVRFRKEGDLRMISHRDLLRVFERLFRRAAVPLRLSEGFHPKAKLSFPSALALGIRGADEVMEVELAQQIPAAELLERFNGQAPDGLTITDIEILEPGASKAQPANMTYELPVPQNRRAEVQGAIERLQAQPSIPVQRDGRHEPIELRDGLDLVELDEDVLRFRLRASRTAGVRPREVIAALGLADLEDQGFYITRTAVQIAPPSKQKSTP